MIQKSLAARCSCRSRKACGGMVCSATLRGPVMRYSPSCHQWRSRCRTGSPVTSPNRVATEDFPAPMQPTTATRRTKRFSLNDDNMARAFWRGSSTADAVGDVGGVRWVDHLGDLQLDARRQHVEQPTTTAEQHRNLVALQLIGELVAPCRHDARLARA